MWTPEHRRSANRNGLRYPSDLTDDEWAIVAPMIGTTAIYSDASGPEELRFASLFWTFRNRH